MTIDSRCLVCKSPDRRRLIELGWNGGMGAETIARVLDQKGLAAATVLRHLKEHADGVASQRAVDVEPETPVRERILTLQRMQLDEVERRITLAKQRADQLNAALDDLGDTDSERHDWSEFFDLLSKDGQAALATILKTQGLTDKREAKQGDLKLGLFEAMSKAGLAPKALSGGDLPALPPGDDDGD